MIDGATSNVDQNTDLLIQNILQEKFKKLYSINSLVTFEFSYNATTRCVLGIFFILVNIFVTVDFVMYDVGCSCATAHDSTKQEGALFVQTQVT